MYAPANKGFAYNWLPISEPPPRPDCTCRELINGEWVSIAHRHKAPENPRQKAPWPAPRQGRRDALLARKDNVLTWATPYGFVAAFHLDPDQPGLAHELELRYLIETQDRELAPIWLELKENGIDAVSQSSSKSSSDDDDTVIADIIKDDAEAIYTTPEDTRRELWWRTEDEYRWYCGPALKARYIPLSTSETAVTIRCLEKGSLTKQQSTEWINHIVAEDRAHENIPRREMLVGAIEELRARKAWYGDDWAITLLSPEEIDAFPQLRRITTQLDKEDADPGRERFDKEDVEQDFQERRPGYAGNGSLGFDDWEMTERSYYEDIDFDPEKIALFETGEWGD